MDSWRTLRPALVLGALLLLTGAATLVYGRITDDWSPWPLAVMSAIDALLIVAFVAAYEPALWSRLRPDTVEGRDWALALGLFAVTGVVLHFWFALLLTLFEDIELLADFREHDWPLWSAFLLVVLMPAVFEELAFRGFLLRRFARVMAVRDAVVLQAIWFAIVHFLPGSLPSHFAIGLVLGWVALRTGSLVPGMFGHAAWNTWVLVQELAAA